MKKFSLVTFLALVSWLSFADEESVHGMVIFGKTSTYVSHLPMFHSPHDYQLIATVDISDHILKQMQGGITQELFTIAPEPMDLSKVIAGDIKSFPATVYRGHFERDGVAIGKTIIHIKNILVGKKIVKENGTSTDFIVFGKDGEYFAAHLIKGQPTYDAIYKVERPFKTIIPPCGRAGCDNSYDRPIPDSALPIIVEAKAQFRSVHPVGITIGQLSAQISVGTPFYYEYGDLAH